jgi:acetyl esterase
MALDPFFAARFATVAGVTWADVLGGDADAIAKAIEYGAPTDTYATPRDVATRDLEASGPHGAVPVRVYNTDDGNAGGTCLVWMHGGAFQFGDLDMVEAHAVAAEIARRTPAVLPPLARFDADSRRRIYSDYLGDA